MELNRPIKKKRALWLLLLLVPIFLAACPVVYSLGALSQARKLGVYASPEEAATAIAEHDFRDITSIRIHNAGVNRHDGQDPHIWFVAMQICAAGTLDGGPMWRDGCTEGGSHFLHMRDGWVMMPESRFPLFVGWWMKKMGMAGT